MAELEWYCREEDSSMIFEKALSQCKEFYYKILGFSEKNLRFRDLPKEDLAHYSKRTIDVEYSSHGDGLKFNDLQIELIMIFQINTEEKMFML